MHRSPWLIGLLATAIGGLMFSVGLLEATRADAQDVSPTAAQTEAADPQAASPSATVPIADDEPRDPAAYCSRQLGSWFYCEPQATVDQAATGVAPNDPPKELAELAAYQKELDDAGKIASWNPTSENVERYMRLQRISMDKSGLFSDLWRRVVWNNPDLDYTIQRPTGSVAKNEFDSERSSDRDLFLRSVSGEVGVFYVYSGVCGPCRVASPIIKEFSDRYGVPVKVISTDGSENPVFGPTLADHGQLKAWGIEHPVTPALLIYQAPSRPDADGNYQPQPIATVEGRQMSLRPCIQARGCLTYLGAGVMSVEDIAERFFVLLSKDPGADY